MTKNRRSIVSTVALTAALGLAAVGLSQCRMVDDTITGVELRPNASFAGKSVCIHRCNEDYKTALKREDDRHKDAARACGKNKTCKDAEDKRHKEAKDDINDAKKDCKKTCYNEGSGNGGR